MESVARRAGVNKTTLYRRWGDRDALVLDAVLERAIEWVPIPDTGSVREDLRQLAREIIANVSTPELQAVIRAFVAEAPRESALAARGRVFWAARFAADRQIISRGVARGELSPEADPDLVIEMLLGPIYLRLLITGEPLDMTAAERVIDLILTALAPKR
jgi:AcrR family transcriptional regulator